MAVIPYLYRRLRGLGLPETQAQLFADTETTLTMPAVTQLNGEEELLPAAVDKINELIVAMQTAGMMDEEEA